MNRFSAQIVVNSGGYRWRDLITLAEQKTEGVPRASVRLLVPISRRAERPWRAMGEAYDPFLKERALFRIFANLGPSERRILEFANRYGDIASHRQILKGYGLALKRWRYEIKKMRRAVHFLDQIGDCSKRLSSASERKLQSGFVDRLVREMPVTLTVTQIDGRAVVQTVCHCLLDAMKVQLVEALQEDKRYHDCAHCNKPFEVTPSVSRSDRIHCSTNCRVKHCYQRKKQAVTLHRQGRSVPQIVKAVGSDSKTVSTWIKNIRRNG
ncbi:MAG TPA: hypothetical protein VGN12_29395 [Pirellulales bacterium]|jgi:transposase-like protein